MFKQKRILAVIPARGGSKGVPRKNVRLAGGKPLIAWMIEAANNSQYIDRLILSSDDDEIIQVAESYGCEAPFIRPPELASDESSSADVLLHALKQIVGYDYVMLLQPTSPLTASEDIDGCIEECINSEAKSMISVTEADKNPYWMFNLGTKNRLEPIFNKAFFEKRRQELPRIYIPSGAIYISNSDWFLRHRTFYSEETSGFYIPKERSLDIDTQTDFNLFEVIYKEGAGYQI